MYEELCYFNFSYNYTDNSLNFVAVPLAVVVPDLASSHSQNVYNAGIYAQQTVAIGQTSMWFR